MGRRRRGVAVVLLTVALAVAAVLGAYANLASGAPAAGNKARAQSDATSLLEGLVLPQGATQTSTEPGGDGGVLATPASGPPATPNVVDDHAWWTVPGSPQSVLAYLDAHAPAGSAPDLRGSGTDPSRKPSDFWWVGFARPPITGVLDIRWLIVEVVQLPDGSTGLRADAEVVWITPRPPSEQIPAGATQLRVGVSSAKTNLQPPFTVTEQSQIEAVAALLNALPCSRREPAFVRWTGAPRFTWLSTPRERRRRSRPRPSTRAAVRACS